MRPASANSGGFGSRTSFGAAPPSAPPTPWLVAATDLGLLAALWAVPAALGGRSALGHGLLAAIAAWTAGAWALHQFLASERRWIWTGGEWLWAACLALVGLQLAQLPAEWLDFLSPQHAQLLAGWGAGPDDGADGVLGRRWSQLSLTPSATLAGLNAFVAYGLLFFVTVQRLRQLADVERMLKWIACAAVAMAVFSLLQYFLGNGKFFWVFPHPFVQTTRYNLGTFVNRNHFSHFLALGLGPLMWWWLRTTEVAPAPPPAAGRFRPPPPAPQRGLTLLFLGAIAVVVFAAVLSLSRGGLLGMAIAGLVSLLGFKRTGRISPQFVLGLAGAAALIGGGAWIVGGQELSQRIELNGPEERLIIWRANLDVIRHFPWLGTGVGSHVHAHQLYLDRIYDRHEFTHAESSYLQVASETGLVGLGLSLIMAGLCLGWARGVVRRQVDAGLASAASAVFGSLSGHAVHALFDFLWYIPGCMVVIVGLAASARRLSQLDREARGLCGPPWRPPRLWWGLALCGLVALCPWLVRQPAPAVAAEPFWFRYLTLVYEPWELHPEEESPGTSADVQRDKARAISAAAKADVHDARFQVAAALAYLRQFEDRQQQSDNPMSLTELRDAVNASQFESQAAVRAWMAKATGKNLKWLDAAWRSAERTVREAPLEGIAYVYLAELSFLHDPSGGLKQRLLQQALAVRPYDPHVQFAVGEEALLAGDEDTALKHWKDAFRRGASFQAKVATVLAITKPPEFFLTEFEPDWEAQGRIVAAYRALGRQPELSQMLASYAAAARQAAEQLHGAQREAAWNAARHAYLELQQPEQAIAVLEDVLRHEPLNVALRTALGTDLFHQQRFTEAAEHLRWASSRQPDDEGLRQLAEQAVQAGLRSSPRSAERVTPAGFRQSR